MRIRSLVLIVVIPLLAVVGARAQEEAEWTAARVDADLFHLDPDAAFWAGAEERTISLMAQPMVTPRPVETTTPELYVQAVHDGTWLALRLRWADPERSEAGRPGEYSDAAAVQFPMQPAEFPPPVFMGVKGNPVHIFHWRAQYQRDREVGKPTMRDLYPNMNVDMYPMELADAGSLDLDPASREPFSPGRAEGNPQSFAKTGVDEIWAEGFSTSSVQESAARGEGRWADGWWTLEIVRPLAREGGSVFAPGDRTFVAFAVWQGGRDEVGSRKSVTMVWTPLRIAGEAP